MVESCVAGKWKTYLHLFEALGLGDREAPVISIVGAGGKTTIIKELMAEYGRRKKAVIVTTSTHIQHIEEPYFLGEPSMQKLKEKLELYGKVWMGKRSSAGKIEAFSDVFLKEVLALRLPMLVEADGAKHFPCKAPDAHEPVIWPDTTMVLSVYGTNAIGGEISKVCFRAECVCGILEKSGDEKLAAYDIARLGSDARGGKKNVKQGMEYHVILNQVEREERALSMEIAEELWNRGISRVHLVEKNNSINQRSGKCLY